MHYIEETINGIYLLTLKGKLMGPPETDNLHERIKKAIENDSKNIVLDLKNVTMMASLGIGALMRALSTVRNAGGDLRLSGLTEKVKSIFEITRVIGIVQIYNSSQEALESFSK